MSQKDLSFLSSGKSFSWVFGHSYIKVTQLLPQRVYEQCNLLALWVDQCSRSTEIT